MLTLRLQSHLHLKFYYDYYEYEAFEGWNILIPWALLLKYYNSLHVSINIKMKFLFDIKCWHEENYNIWVIKLKELEYSNPQMPRIHNSHNNIQGVSVTGAAKSAFQPWIF